MVYHSNLFLISYCIIIFGGFLIFSFILFLYF